MVRGQRAEGRRLLCRRQKAAMQVAEGCYAEGCYAKRSIFVKNPVSVVGCVSPVVVRGRSFQL
ncbi:hypothetical protein [Phormidium nigroviride]